ncbi:MAG: hypothetical protein E5Y58_07635 [Mesorhizobium sp.]|nr:MAG: hypothetical protein E5Y58_07635 [Mesorhizobium sp.]
MAFFVLKHMAEAVDEFLAEIGPLAPAYDTPVFCFVAVRKSDGYHIVQGRLHLDSAPDFVPKRLFESLDVLAGQSVLHGGPDAIRSFLLDFAKGKVAVTGFDLIFDHPKEVNTTVDRFHDEGVRDQRRLPILTARGDSQFSYALQPETDWQLRAAAVPYDNLHELANDYSTGFIGSEGATFVVVPAPVGFVVYGSPFHGTEATPTVCINRRLNPQEVSLGLRVVLNDAVVERRSITGTDVYWVPEGNLLRGTATISVPDGSSIQCILRYRGKALHYGHLYDQERTPNVRRTVLQTYDPNLEAIGKLLFVETGKNKPGKSSDLERGIAWLLWLLGFSVIDLGVSTQTTDAVDIVAVSPTGVILLVECTTGVLKAESKLASLAARFIRMQRQVATRNTKIIPILVTSLTRSEVSADLEEARTQGVLVLTREDLKYALATRSLFPPHPDKLIHEMERAMESTAPGRIA